MKKIVEKIFQIASRIAIWRNRYRIVAITGSAGKTSTKKAVVLVLKSRHSVLAHEDEGYNTELGMPLTLLEKKIPQSKIGWFFLTGLCLFYAFKKRPYRYCVLEMAADKQGDIGKLTDFARPNVSVITNVFPVHLINFKTVENIAQEKSRILDPLDKGDVAVLNADDLSVAQMTVPAAVKRIFFGRKNAKVTILGQEIDGTFSINRLTVGETELRIKVRAIGEQLLYIFGAAIAVGIGENIPLAKIEAALNKFQPVPGRFTLIPGLKESLIIDDSYNANPASMKVALDSLQGFRNARKIALLGNMNELGDQETAAHREVAEYLRDKIDILVTVGKLAKEHIAQPNKNKLPIYSFATSEEAGEFLQKFVRSGDVILAKGSQNGVWMERAVKKIMAEPEKASELLCRQGGIWSKK